MAHCHVSSSGECAVGAGLILRAAACRLEMVGAVAGLRVSGGSVTLVDTCLVESGAWPQGAREMPMVAARSAVLRLLRTSSMCPRTFALVADSAVTAVGCSAVWLQSPDEDHATSHSGSGTKTPRPALSCTDSAIKLWGVSITGFKAGVAAMHGESLGQGTSRLQATCRDVLFAACQVAVTTACEHGRKATASLNMVRCSMHGGATGILARGLAAVRIT